MPRDSRCQVFLLMSIAILLCVGTLRAGAPGLSWTRTYGGEDDEYANAVIVTPDGGYLIAGSTGNWDVWSYPPQSPRLDLYLLKTDASGDSLWARTYRRCTLNEASSVQNTSDGGYVVVGWTGEMDADHMPTQIDAYLLRLDADGDTLWTATYGDTANDYGCAVLQTHDGGFIIAGETGSFEHFDVSLIRTDPDGHTLWTKRFGDTEWDQAWAICETFEGGYILFGNTITSRSGSPDYDAYLAKTDADGDTLWTKVCGGSKSDLAFDGRQTSDGGFILTGWTNSFGAGSQDGYVVKTDAWGNVLWTKTFGGPGHDYGQSVIEALDGGLVAAGQTLPDMGTWDVYVMKMDALGHLLWETTYEGLGTDLCYSIQQAPDGGYVIAGNVVPADWGWGLPEDSDILLMKTEPDTTWQGLVVDLVAAPNPARAGVVLYYSLPSAAQVRVAVYDILGREIRVLAAEDQYPGTHAARWDGTDRDGRPVGSGIYFCKFQAGSAVATEKVVIIR